MRLLGVIFDIIRRPERVDRRFEVDDVAFSEFFRVAVKGEQLDARETLMNAENTVGTMVAPSDGYLAGLEPGLQRGI